MKNVVLLIQRRVLADSLYRLARADTPLRFYIESNPDNALFAIEHYKAALAVVEVPESGEHSVRDSLRLCAQIRASQFRCKILLLCSESSKESREEAVRAKLEQRIDDFIFYDTSVEYLMSKLESM